VSSWERIASRNLQTLKLDRVRNKILAFSVLATLIPSLTIGWLAYPQSKHALTQTIATDLLGVSSQSASDLSLWVNERLYDLKIFSNSYEVSDNLYPRAASKQAALGRLADYLESVRERTPRYREMVVFDRSGRAVASSPEHGTLIQLPGSWSAKLSAGEVVVGDPVWDPTARAMAVVIARPIVPATGQPLGVLAARLDLRDLQQRLEAGVRGHAGIAYVVSENGRRLLTSHPDSLRPVGGQLDGEALRGLTIPSRDVAEYTNPDTVPVIGTLRPIAGTGWSVVAELPRSEGYRHINELLSRTVVALGGLFLVVGLLAYLLGLLIVRPLERLSKGAAQVAGGDFNVHLPVVTGGELGYLTTVFNDMVARLKESMRQVDAVNETLREKNAQLERLSLTDPLTGLYNRRHLMSTLESELKRAARSHSECALLMIDVDHFKSYNDAFGHQAGDDALIKVAGVLRSVLREVDCAARYGGEEFVVLLPETGLGEAADVAERIRTVLRGTPFQSDPVTLSVGVAAYPAQARSLESLIAAADNALYHAKRQGRDRVSRADRLQLADASVAG
jgi:diguanylate cyclase (GGDEF)-like protein